VRPATAHPTPGTGAQGLKQASKKEGMRQVQDERGEADLPNGGGSSTTTSTKGDEWGAHNRAR